jgi:hypothetical protein
MPNSDTVDWSDRTELDFMEKHLSRAAVLYGLEVGTRQLFLSPLIANPQTFFVSSLTPNPQIFHFCQFLIP